MLSPEQMRQVEQLSGQLAPRQLDWLSGYLAGLHASPAPSVTVGEPPRATVLYGSQTGNSKMLAEQTVSLAKQKGLHAEAISMNDYKTARLKKEQFLFAVVSTHGEGDPPDAALGFFDFVLGTRAPKLPNLSFSVLALGDSSYEHFCKAGRDLDSRLRELGAAPLSAIVECDLDFERAAQKWSEATVGDLERAAATEDVLPMSVESAPAVHNRSNPFSAQLLLNLALNERTRHLELSLEGSGLSYRPGDSLGVWPQNSREDAEQTAALLGLEWNAEIELQEERALVSEWLMSRLEIASLTPAVLSRYAATSPNAAQLSDSDRAKAYVAGRNWNDLLRDFPPPPDAVPEVLECARRLAPRLYSAASSPRAREEEAHILVARDTYSSANGAIRSGVCSSYLSNLQEGDLIKVFVQGNENFRLPDDNAAPLLMIGPGTGVAPFRAFMEEREERGSGGKNWLLFGARRRREDFYYQTEWQARLKSGVLTRLDAAFSRDGKGKKYVQHIMRERADELREWIGNGAYIYVCGDEKRMAADVHAALCELVGNNSEDGEAEMEKLRAAGRYQRDVY